MSEGGRQAMSEGEPMTLQGMAETLMRRLPMYILLPDHSVSVCDDMNAWGAFMENIDLRRVKLDVVDRYEVSTVFLGIDHSMGRGEPGGRRRKPGALRDDGIHSR